MGAIGSLGLSATADKSSNQKSYKGKKQLTYDDSCDIIIIYKLKFHYVSAPFDLYIIIIYKSNGALT